MRQDAVSREAAFSLALSSYTASVIFYRKGAKDAKQDQENIAMVCERFAVQAKMVAARRFPIPPLASFASFAPFAVNSDNG